MARGVTAAVRHATVFPPIPPLACAAMHVKIARAMAATDRGILIARSLAVWDRARHSRFVEPPMIRRHAITEVTDAPKHLFTALAMLPTQLLLAKWRTSTVRNFARFTGVAKLAHASVTLGLARAMAAALVERTVTANLAIRAAVPIPTDTLVSGTVAPPMTRTRVEGAVLLA